MSLHSVLYVELENDRLPLASFVFTRIWLIHGDKNKNKNIIFN